jgi:hypothetical protein
MRAMAAAVSVVLAGCSAGPMIPAVPIALVPAQYDSVTMQLADMPASGGVLDLVRPPQGGYVSFVGARARNLTDGNVEIHGRLLDPQTNAIRFEDVRVVQLRRDGADPDAWLPDLRSYVNVANVAVCPSTGTGDLYNVPFTLQVELRETSTPRVGVASVAIMTACRQTDAQDLARCQCECAANFMLGKCP